MKLRDIRSCDLTGKRVLIRTDFNVLVGDDGKVRDDFKVRSARETIAYVRSFPGTRIALATHFGRPDGTVDKAFSLSRVRASLSEILEVELAMVCDCVGVCVENALSDDQEQGSKKSHRVLLLENLRFHAGEKSNDAEFARNLAAPFDVYINDAFAVCHRAHASVHAITQHIESYAGIWLQREVETLSDIRSDVESPAVALIGGAKIQTKLPLIEKFDAHYDHILVGGKTAVEAVEGGMTFSDKVILPVDFAQDDLDIGPLTIAEFVGHVQKAKTIVWNGPMGKFEQPPYDAGTREVAQAIAQNHEAFSVVGGGESVQALDATELFDNISFVSTGGGAMLAFLAEEEMPALDVLADEN